MNYSCEQAAPMLGVKVATVYKYCRNGEIEFINQGNRYVIPEASIIHFNESRKNRRKRRTK